MCSCKNRPCVCHWVSFWFQNIVLIKKRPFVYITCFFTLASWSLNQDFLFFDNPYSRIRIFHNVWLTSSFKLFRIVSKIFFETICMINRLLFKFHFWNLKYRRLLSLLFSLECVQEYLMIFLSWLFERSLWRKWTWSVIQSNIYEPIVLSFKFFIIV